MFPASLIINLLAKTNEEQISKGWKRISQPWYNNLRGKSSPSPRFYSTHASSAAWASPWPDAGAEESPEARWPCPLPLGDLHDPHPDPGSPGPPSACGSAGLNKYKRVIIHTLKVFLAQQEQKFLGNNNKEELTIKFHEFFNKGSIIISYELICILFVILTKEYYYGHTRKYSINPLPKHVLWIQTMNFLVNIAIFAHSLRQSRPITYFYFF